MLRAHGLGRLKLKTIVLGSCCLFFSVYFISLWRQSVDGLGSEETDGLSYGQQKLRERILALSRLYVDDLAKEQLGQRDHLYAGPGRNKWNFDMKKTIAVLLSDVISRLEKLESDLDNLNHNGSLGQSTQQRLAHSDERRGLMEVFDRGNEECTLPEDYKTHFPNCDAKLDWMKTFWRSDPCYASYGVDGSFCSMVIYLSEVEQFCPRLKFRPSLKEASGTPSPDFYAVPNTQLGDLFARMTDNPVNFEWIKARISRMWPSWLAALARISEKQDWTLAKRPRKRVLLHLGLLTKESGFKFGEKSLKGGPLGELVQWSDLIASLHILGHDVIISSEIRTFLDYAKADPALKSSCPVPAGREHASVIYTDIVGLRQIKKKMRASLQNYKCRLRVLDSFGTQAEFNSMQYYVKHKGDFGKGKVKNIWGGHDLMLKQFYTMYPHSHDNTFLGFVVESHLLPPNMSLPSEGAYSTVSPDHRSARKPWALVYGKEAYMWRGKEKYLEEIRDLVEIHGTVTEEQMGSKKSREEPYSLPGFVENHGVQSGEGFHALLRQSSLFLGLGFPYEGPAPLEAIANGAVFINPRFGTPKSRRTEAFFADKPTFRGLKSQNPYTEDFVGPPYVLTVDLDNTTELRAAVREALSIEVTPFLPFEFTPDGMLERLNAFLEHQDLCTDSLQANWPPMTALQLTTGPPGQSCQDVCWSGGAICEPSYFPKVNNEATLRDQSAKIRAPRPCPETSEMAVIYAPAFVLLANEEAGGAVIGQCVLQENQLLYSCASEPPSNVRRICPCRDYVKGQSALCAACM